MLCRDIKLENAMLHKAGDNILLKLTDFGYAKASSIDSSPRSRVGTPSYAGELGFGSVSDSVFECCARGQRGR